MAATEKPTVVEALIAVMADTQAIAKGDMNTQQHYLFRGIDAVVNAVGPVLRKHSVLVLPAQVESAYRDVRTSTDKPSRECTVKVTYRFYGPAGDWIEAQVPGESMDFGDKGAAKAMSVAFRIALLQALCIPTSDPDPDSQSYERGTPAPQPASQPPAPADDAAVVVADLMAVVKELGLNAKDVAGQFAEWHATHLTVAQAAKDDPDAVRGFTERLANSEITAGSAA